jgi:sugar phosphate isomerase/epimerase
MRYGICGNPEIATLAAEAGYDYFEWSVGSLLKPLEDEDAFQTALKEARAASLPCEAVNVFVPPHLKITGPQVDFSYLRHYAATALRRAEEAGVQVIVFGSGGARAIPDGYPRPAAWDQLVEFCSMLGPQAHDHGVTIAIEPLNRKECNVLNSVGEAVSLARAVMHPSIRVLVDAYHWAIDQDSIEDLISAGPLLAHAHIATLANRRPPGIEPQDFGPFFSALEQAEYQARISIEARIDDPIVELPVAIQALRKLDPK